VPAGIAIALLLAWEAGVRSGQVRALFFPAPTFIAQTISAYLASGLLLTHLGATVTRVALAIVLGGIPGALLGLAMGRSRTMRRVVDPFVAAAHAVPKVAVLPLFLMFLGIGETPKIVVATLGAFFPMVINTMEGVRQINPVHFDVARNYGAGSLKMATRVLLPGSVPFMLSGLRLAFNATLLLTITVEMIGARTGLGVMIWRAWETLRIEQMYASLATIMLLGVGSNLVIQWLTSALVPWQRQREI
jgi:NitT/TauT family transport system permease protein